MSAIRSALFMLWATLWTILVAPGVILFALLLRGKWGYRAGWFWRQGFMLGVRHILGIRTRVIGQENMPAEACVMLAKHQSAWETVALQDLVPSGSYCVFVLKRELLRLPFFGWALGAMKMISIDRGSVREALEQVVKQGTARLAAGFYVIIFPEGTRVAPGEHKRFKVGGALLATRAGCQVVPVAHDAGEVWPRQAFLKKTGTITVSIGPAFSTVGLSEQEVNRRAEAWVEAEMRRLSPHRYPDAGNAAG